MRASRLPEWHEIADEGHRLNENVWERLRGVAARQHLEHPSVPMPGRLIAAIDMLAHPLRSKLTARDANATDRDRATAIADDLHDAVGQCWLLLPTLEEHAGPERVVAELVAAGRWLAQVPVWGAQHEQQVEQLFDPVGATA